MRTNTTVQFFITNYCIRDQPKYWNWAHTRKEKNSADLRFATLFGEESVTTDEKYVFIPIQFFFLFESVSFPELSQHFCP